MSAATAVAAATIPSEKAAIKPGFEETLPTKSFRIRMTLSSTKVRALEQACKDLLAQAKRFSCPTKGPIRFPTKVLRITTRKTPCGEGSKTWDRFEMRIHKRIIDLNCTMEAMKQITAIKIESGVDVEVTVADQ